MIGIGWLKTQVFRRQRHPGIDPKHTGGGRRYYRRSRWKPHQGKRECARRLAKLPVAG